MTETNLIEDLRLLYPPSYTWALGLAVVAGGLVLVVWFVRRRVPLSTAPEPADPLAAWEETLRGLERLLPLLQPNQSRAYAIASTGLLRRYLERRFGLAAPRLATEEFLAAARHSNALAEADRGRLGEYLRWCDLLKFGRALAETAELGRLHEAAVQFVTRSRPAETRQAERQEVTR